MNECDFAAQLTFGEGRQRTSDIGSAANAGFYFYNSGTLFLKFPEASVQTLNQNLLLDLGDELNEKLAELGEDGYMIVLVDNRGTHADGIPTPDDEGSCGRALREGPNAFLTDYTKEIAGHSGWTNGHAHM